MAKKDYTQSPALAFIGGAAEQAEQADQKNGGRTRTVTIPEGMTLNDMLIEKRTRRVQLVMQPSVYDRAKAEAERRGISFNDYVHALIAADLDSSAE